MRMRKNDCVIEEKKLEKSETRRQAQKTKRKKTGKSLENVWKKYDAIEEKVWKNYAWKKT